MNAGILEIKKATKAVMKELHSMAKKPNRDYEAIADAIEAWLKNKTRANFSKAARLVVPYVEDVVEDMEMRDKELSFSDTQITDIAETVVEDHAKHMNESADCGCGDGMTDLSEDADYIASQKTKTSLVRGLMERVVRKLR
jgi:hypothetical protein